MCIYEEESYYKECLDCQCKDAIIDDAKYWFKAILNHLYGKKELNLEDLERCLDELGMQLDVRIPENDLQINGKFLPEDVIDEWKKFNTVYLQHLAVGV